MLPWQRTHVVKSQQRHCSLCNSCIIRCLLHCCLVAGFCNDPQIIDVGTGSRTFVPNLSTCNTTSSWACRRANDYTYQLAAAAVDRLITVSTCVDNVTAWDTVLFAFPTQGSSCFTCPVRHWLGGIASWLWTLCVIVMLVVCDVWPVCAALTSCQDCGVPAINVTDPPGIRSEAINPALTATRGFVTQGRTFVDDDNGLCGQRRSRLTFTVPAGQAYTVVVENYPFSDRTGP
ncbi:hypothetical protein QJQ45_029711, partial [Haematococcus lacustris]